MTTKIVDISDEIYRELGEPADISVASISHWLRTNLEKVNILLDKKYLINSINLEIENNNNEIFGLAEKNIFKLLYFLYYYERLFRNALGAASVDSVVSVTDDGSTVTKINKNEIAKNYAQIRKQINNELVNFINHYRANEVAPVQIVGDDTIPGNFEKDINTYIRIN
jgi:hypothetical protein